MEGCGLKRCKVCRQPFEPRPPRALVCSEDCAGAFAVSKRLKEERRAEKAAQALERKDTKARKEKLKTRAQWLAECQAVANKYARIRDAKDGCISCDKPACWDGQWHGSHLRSVGAASAVRFNLWNINKSCSVCNNYLSGNVREYEIRLRAKIGNAKVDWLYTQNQAIAYNIDYLRKFKFIIGKRLKRMEKALCLE